MMFPLRIDDAAPQSTGITLGSTTQISVTREFHIECMYLVVDVTPSAAMATAAADALQGILKNVTVQFSDGARTRNVVSASGPALLEYWKQIGGTLDRDTLTNIGTNPASGTKRLVYPIPFCLPNLADPANMFLLLPAPRAVQNINVSCQWASQTDMDTNATPTFAVSSLKARLIVQRRFVPVKNWPTYDTELTENVNAIAANAANQSIELASPGSYTGILFRGYTSLTAHGDITQSGGYMSLKLLGTVMRRQQWLDLQFINDLSNTPEIGTGVNVFTGSVFWDFLSDHLGDTASEFGSVLDANIPVATGARLQLVADLNGGSNVTLKMLSHRIFGNLDRFKMVNRLNMGATKKV